MSACVRLALLGYRGGGDGGVGGRGDRGRCRAFINHAQWWWWRRHDSGGRECGGNRRRRFEKRVGGKIDKRAIQVD